MYNHRNTLMDTWESVWKCICEMAYENRPPCEKIIMKPGEIENSTKEEDTLTYTWKIYSKKHGSTMPGVVPEFKELYIPRHLFQDHGVYPWFRHSFPNCQIHFWE